MTDRRRKRVQKTVKILLAAAIVLFLAVLCFFLPYSALLPAYKLPQREEGELRLHVLSGVGDCCIVEFPSGNVLVVNAGDGSLKSRNTISRYLKGLRPNGISVLATDTDSDCVGGFVRIIESYPVERAYLPAGTKEAGAYASFLSALEKKSVNAGHIVRYDTIEDPSGAYAVCLSPYRGETEDASVVLWLSHRGVNFLLAGNASASRENKLAEEHLIDESIFDAGKFTVRLNETHVYLTSRHGLAGGTGSAFLRVSGIKTALICCGRDYAPSAETVKLLTDANAEIYRTDELGAIAVSVKDGAYRVIPHFGE